MTARLTYLHGNPGSNRGRDGAMLAALCLAVAAGSVALAADFGRADAPSRTSAPHETAGAFTGAFVNGVPVYRLPSITVVGHRDAELAREMRDPGSAPARRVEARTVTRPCPHIAESAASLTHVRVL